MGMSFALQSGCLGSNSCRYGPSECSVCSVAHRVGDAEMDPRHIGASVSCRVWVVDVEDYHRLVPIGCVGELLIEGHIVGRGYLNEPAKTAEVFVDRAAFACSRSFRGYLTGDLVVQNPDGTLDIMGRKDSQVVRIDNFPSLSVLCF